MMTQVTKLEEVGDLRILIPRQDIVQARLKLKHYLFEGLGGEFRGPVIYDHPMEDSEHSFFGTDGKTILWLKVNENNVVIKDGEVVQKPESWSKYGLPPKECEGHYARMGVAENLGFITPGKMDRNIQKQIRRLAA